MKKKKQERNEKLSIVRQGVGVPITIPALRSGSRRIEFESGPGYIVISRLA